MRHTLFLTLFAVLCLAQSANAQILTARGVGGSAVAVETGQSEKGVILSISPAGFEPQVFDGVGDMLVPLRAGNQTGAVLALDIDRDGIDEIFVRSSQGGQQGVLIVFRWDGSAGQYVPVNFVEDIGTTRPYLMVHVSQPVSVNGITVEANHDKTDNGRTRLRVFRYRWDGNGFAQTTDN